MSTRRTVRILATAAAAPLALGTVLVAPAAHATQGASMPSASYSLAQVKKHNKATDCWSIVGTSVYKLTAWIPKHPGGKGVIVSMCGKNATSLYNSKHRTDPIAKATLARYRIGSAR
jgi:cytochrome b involved in lipid metabolism